MKIHDTAIISKKAKVADDVEVGPYSIIDGNVTIGNGTKIQSHCVITGWTVIGKNNRFYTGAVIGSVPQDLKYKNEKTFVVIGNDNIFREYVTVNPATKEGARTIIGDNNVIMAYAHIAHDCTVRNRVIMANSGTLAGHVVLEDGTVIGGLTAVHQFVRVGALSIVGGCSKVVQDVPPFCTADGHPTRVFGLNKVGLERAGLSEAIQRDLKKAFKILFKSGLAMTHATEIVKKDIPPSKELSHLVDFIASSERGICR